MADTTSPSPLRDPRIRFALLVVLTYAVGFGVIMPVLPELVIELTGTSLAEATTIGGGLAATYAVFQFLFSPQWAIWATGSGGGRWC